jgi:AcrR family transcriptional regulator
MRPEGDRARATEARKAQIATATIAVLAERGYGGTTFEAICEHAGLSSKRLISYHFATKDELFATVLRTVVLDAAAYMRPWLDAAQGARESLAAYIRANVAFIAAHPAHVRAVQQIVFNTPSVPSEEGDAAISRLAALFVDGQRTGSFRTFHSVLMASTLRAALDAAADRLINGLDPHLCADELAETFDRATRADDE